MLYLTFEYIKRHIENSPFCRWNDELPDSEIVQSWKNKGTKRWKGFLSVSNEKHLQKVGIPFQLKEYFGALESCLNI